MIYLIDLGISIVDDLVQFLVFYYPLVVLLISLLVYCDLDFELKSIIYSLFGSNLLLLMEYQMDWLVFDHFFLIDDVQISFLFVFQPEYLACSFLAVYVSYLLPIFSLHVQSALF